MLLRASLAGPSSKGAEASPSPKGAETSIAVDYEEEGRLWNKLSGWTKTSASGTHANHT